VKKNIGSTFESWLREEGIYEEVSANAIKRVRARQSAGGAGPDIDRQARQRPQSGPGTNGANMKNIAGNEISIFLFRFVLRGRSIDFVLNEEIAADMYPEVDEELKPLVHACCETLLRYRHLSVSDNIMDGSFLTSGGFEVMLSKGLGSHFAEDEKARLFQDAKRIADLLATVMERRTQDLKQGKQPFPPPLAHSPDPRNIKQGLEKLGKAKHHEAQLQWFAEGRPRRAGLRPWGCLRMSPRQAAMTIAWIVFSSSTSDWGSSAGSC